MIETTVFKTNPLWFFVRKHTQRFLVISFFLACFGLFMIGGSQTSESAQSQQHLWVGDVPIMPELSIEPALGFAFDSPNGRIVMIFASSDASAREIMLFYNEALGAIGWIGSDGMWRRGTETLVISEVSTAAGGLWRLMVRPN